MSNFVFHLYGCAGTDGHLILRLKHSCEFQLLVTVNDIARAINDNKQVDAAILDFSKVFDKVAHLIYKLDYYGIRGILLNWLTSFLQNRSQEVIYSRGYEFILM